MLRETLAGDPELARQILRPLLGGVMPIVGGACGSYCIGHLGMAASMAAMRRMVSWSAVTTFA